MLNKTIFISFLLGQMAFSQQFDSNNTFNKQGNLGVTNTNTNQVSTRGTIQSNYVVGETIDRWGNKLTALPEIGYFNFPGTTHVQTWTSDMQNLSNPVTFTSNATIGALSGYSIIQSGTVSGNFSLFIAGPTRTLGPFNGGGKVIWANNSNSAGAGTIDAGATLQMGISPSTAIGQTANAFTIEGTLNLFGAYTASTNVVGAGNTLGANAIVNIEGPNVNGQGIMNFASNSQAGTAIINSKEAYTVYPSTSMAATWNINDGASIFIQNGSYTGNVKLNSCTGGWIDGAGMEYPNMLSGPNGKVFVGPCGGSMGTISTTASFVSSSILTGSGDLRIGRVGNTGSMILQGDATNYTGTMTIYSGQVQPTEPALKAAKIRLADPASLLPSGASGSFVTVKSVQSVSPSDTTARLFISLVGLTITNQDPEPFYGTFASASNNSIFIQNGNFQIASTTGGATQTTLYIQNSARVGGYGANAKYGGPLTIQTVNGGLSLKNNPSTLIVTTFTAPSGFKVDIDAAFTAGTYTLLNTTSHTGNPIPLVGSNITGLTPSFAWVGNDLVMTLL